MKLAAAALLFASAGMLGAQAPIDITYRIINGNNMPESMSDNSSENLGVIVFVKSWDPAVAKIEVRLEYSDEKGTHVITKTVDKVDGGRAFNMTTRPVLFTVSLIKIESIMAFGYSKVWGVPWKQPSGQ